MTSPLAWRLLHRTLLSTASLIVPGPQRAEWLREWRGELWHVRQACSPQNNAIPDRQREVTAFCLGAFQDAFCIRRAEDRNQSFFAGLRGTPRLCLLTMAAILALAYTVALLLPGIRAERNLWPRKLNPNLVVIEGQGSNNDAVPTISPSEFRAWQGRRQMYFDALAFYQVRRQSVDPELLAGLLKRKATWAVAQTSPNLFTLLGLPLWFADRAQASSGAEPRLILSESLWKNDFGADPHVVGTEVRLGQRSAKIAAVAPDGSIGLPGRVDAWLVDPDAAEHATGPGYVVAHLTADGSAQLWGSFVSIAALGPDNTEDELLGVAIEECQPSPMSIYLFGLLLAVLALPAITSVSLGEYSINPQQTPWSTKLLRWSFLAAKAALLLPIVYFVALDLAYGCTWVSRESAVYIQLACGFALCLFGMGWVLKDQRQRCPVCLRCVAHPAQVGQASRTFLDWNGTEMMCMGGHTLLHVPSLPTSWFSTQRWLYLDTSWGFLFAGSTRPIP